MLKSEVLSIFHKIFIFFSAQGIDSLSVCWPHKAPQSRFPLGAPGREGLSESRFPCVLPCPGAPTPSRPPPSITEWLSSGSPACVFHLNPESSGQSLLADPNGLVLRNLPAFCQNLVPSIQHINSLSSSLTTSTHLCFGSGCRNEFFLFWLWTIGGRSKILRKLRGTCSIPLFPTYTSKGTECVLRVSSFFHPIANGILITQQKQNKRTAGHQCQFRQLSPSFESCRKFFNRGWNLIVRSPQMCFAWPTAYLFL